MRNDKRYSRAYAKICYIWVVVASMVAMARVCLCVFKCECSCHAKYFLQTKSINLLSIQINVIMDLHFRNQSS